MFLAVYVNSSNDVFEGTAQTNNLAVAPGPIFVQAPDLAVSAIQAPSSVLTDRPFNVTWTLTNLTAAPAVGTWVDKVYLSPDNLSADGILLGQFPFSGALLGGRICWLPVNR